MKLFNLGSSKLRENLLRLYFINPDKEYYLRELEKILNCSVGNIRRELLKLKAAGLFYVRKKGKLNFYFINKNYSLFDELRNIVKKTIGIIDELKKDVAKIDNIEAAFIYGPLAKGNENLNSEIFLFFVGQPDKKIISSTIMKLEKRLKRKISFNFLSVKEFRKKKDENDFFIFDLLKRPKIFLVGNNDQLCK